MKKFLIILFFNLVAFFCCQLLVYAGGPLVVKGGMAVTYGTRPFLYRYDLGTLGMFSNSDAITLIESLYDEWRNVQTAEIKFKRDNPGSLSFDVTASNFDSILNSPDLLGYTPVIFDNDGTLLDAFLGAGAGNSVLGLSGPITVNAGPLVNQIAESQAVFNGRFVNGISAPGDPESSVDALKGTIIHETGHGIGLDHSQINIEAIKPGATQEIRDSVPLLFPIAVNDLFIIRRDDASAVSLLYPNSSTLTMFGKIEGKVLRSNAMAPVLGANIIARNINDPTLEAISCVSDFLKQGTGSYTLFAMPPGDYRIEIEPIDLSFTGASGVGPYSTSKTDESFRNPVPKGFYTGSDKPITTDQNNALIINVAGGQTISNANIVAATSVSSTSSTSSSGTATISEIEPNDDLKTAQFITPPVIISGNASSSDTGEVELTSDTGSMLVISDLFKFTISQSTNLNALLTIESDLVENDLDLALFDDSATKIIETSSQTGNVDELITTMLTPGSYILGVGAFSGSAAYMLQVTLSNEQVPPTLTITGQDTIVLQPTGMNKALLMANASSFSTSSKCTVLSSSASLVKIKPRKFSLSSSNPHKTFRVTVPLSQALDLISNEKEETVTISVTCNNGASDEIDLRITPTIEQVIKNETNHWKILRTDK